MRIQASYVDIRATAQTLQRQAAQFESLYTRMTSRMNELQAVWQGSDAQAFLSQMEGLRPKMTQLKTAVDSYSALLSSSAAAYEALQANRAASARML